MTMREHDKTPEIGPEDEAALDAVFAELAAEAPEPTGDLMARILADAEAVQGARHTSAAVHAQTVAEPPFWAGLWASLGGAAGFTSLVTATLAGLWIGYSPPAALGTLSSGLLGAETDLVEVDGFGLGLEGGLFDETLAEAEG